MFQGISETDADALIKDIDLKEQEFSRGDLVFSPEFDEGKIGFIVQGECEVLRDDNGESKVLLNVLRENDSFGVLSVFSCERFPTYIYAKKKSRICFVEKKQVQSLIERSSLVSMNIIHFLAKRVSFLNSKIETVTMTTVESKLASYLLRKAKDVSSLCFELNIKRCSESISAGRSSVYRTIENLKSAGCIEAENKHIKILDIKKLEEYTK